MQFASVWDGETSGWDRVPRLFLRFGRHLLPAWTTMGRLGALAGAMVFLVEERMRGVSVWLALAIIAANLCGFLFWTAATIRWRGGERYVLLEHALIAAGITVAIASTVDSGLMVVLDPWVAALALTLAFGRIGCLFAGCCHGRPALCGMRYRWRLPWLLAPERWSAVRLFPVQAIEAAALAALAIAGTLLVLWRPGAAAAGLPAAYAVIRFELEIWRGDERSHVGPLSHAQCLCVGVTLLVMLVDVRVGAIGLGVLVALAFVRRRRLGAPFLVVTSEAQMTALAAALGAVRAGQVGVAGTLMLLPDGRSCVRAGGVARPLDDDEARVIAIATGNPAGSSQNDAVGQRS